MESKNAERADTVQGRLPRAGAGGDGEASELLASDAWLSDRATGTVRLFRDPKCSLSEKKR